jgi:DNA polymerase-3 subunit gamma/tau
MLDRIVDLEEVLGSPEAAVGKRGQEASGAAGQRGGKTTPEGQVDLARTAPLASSPAAPIAAPLPNGPTSIEAIRAAWPAVVAAVRSQSRFLGEALAASQPVTLELPWLTVLMSEPNPLFADRLHQESGKVEEVLSRSLGEPVRLRVISGEAPAGAAPGKARRISESSLKAERLREFRSRDPALDTAADALDLEIVD